MNVLVYDSSGTVARLARSLLRGCGHRVSLGNDPEETRLKLETALFDAMIVGPGGVPATVAAVLETDFSDLPLVLAGVASPERRSRRIHSILEYPLSPARFTGVVDRVAATLPSTERILDLPVDIIAGDDRLLCRATKLSSAAMMIEERPLKPDEERSFSQFLSQHRSDSWVAAFRRGDREWRVSGEMAFSESTGGTQEQWAGIRFSDESEGSALEESENAGGDSV